MTHPYLYRPIAVFGGRVLKCCGMASDESRAIVQEKANGGGLCPDSTLLANGVVVELDHYAGDRITADTHQEYARSARLSTRAKATGGAQ